MGKRHIGAYRPFGLEQRFGGQAAELKAPAQAFNRLAFGVGVTLGHTLNALAGDVLGDVFVHFNQDETAVAAVFGILFQHRMACGAATRKAVQNQGVFVRAEAKNAL